MTGSELDDENVRKARVRHAGTSADDRRSRYAREGLGGYEASGIEMDI